MEILLLFYVMSSIAIVHAFSPPTFSSIPMNYYWHEQVQQPQQQQSSGFLPATVKAEETTTTTTTTIKTSKIMTEKQQKAIAKSQRQKVSKFYVEDLSSLTELKYFLEEDERPTIIKFYAKWCKKCQHVGKQVDRLAMEYGDRTIIVANDDGNDLQQTQTVFVDGDVRFAQIEFTQESQSFITESLQIRGTPTLQMYVGTKKLLDGGSSIKSIRDELNIIQNLNDHQELSDRADLADDGIFTSIIDEAFYDSPDFLNEEW